VHAAALAVLAVAALGLAAFAAAAVRERAARAAAISLAGLAATVALAAAIAGAPAGAAVRAVEAGVLLTAGTLAASAAVHRMPAPEPVDLSGATRFDERDHMFARANLAHHPELARRYHEAHPEARETDGRIWALPRLGGPGGRFHDPELSPMADAAFAVLDRTYGPLARRPRGERRQVHPERLLEAVRLLARRYGAADVGVARTEPHHWYSRRGRQAEGWGEPIEPRHPTAIVIVVPMDWHAIRHAPAVPVLLESSRQYVESAKIAHLVAEYLALAGHDATAHVDGHYEVICAALAQAAGLGHVGRMGILMHRRLGPAVRLAVVTTDAELPPTTGDHTHMERFCEICMKCARACPARAIPGGGRPVSRGFAHWSVDQERCYAFWRRIGTDCAVCIRACPFTKPDTAVHRLVRWYVTRNPVAQRIALLADDLFYGRRPRLPAANPPLERVPDGR